MVRMSSAEKSRAFRLRQKLKNKSRLDKEYPMVSSSLNTMDLLSIGEKFGALMFGLLSGTDDLKHLQAVTRQFASVQSLVGMTSEQVQLRKVRKVASQLHTAAPEGPSTSSNLPSYSWDSTPAEKNLDTRNFVKSVSRRFGPRRNSRGYNYAAQLCFMKDTPFAERVGVSRKTFEDLLNRMHEAQKDTIQRRSNEISARIRLLMTIIYLTSKKVYRDIHALFGYSEAAVCRLIYKTINEVNLLSSDAIKWPSDLETTSGEFFKICEFPGVIGSIDAIHLVARAPEKLHDEYRNARGKYTIILLAICDAKKKFTYVSVGYPGTFTDQKCLDSTDLGLNLDVLPNDYFPLKKYHLLANENFNLREGLMVPFRAHEMQSDDQMLFNKRLMATREVTTRTFIEMRSRFQTLSKLDMNIERVVEFTTACCILHNVCLDNDDQWRGQHCHEDDGTSPPMESDFPFPTSGAVAKREIIKDQMYHGLNYG